MMESKSSIEFFMSKFSYFMIMGDASGFPNYITRHFMVGITPSVHELSGV
jgi:hypothetical protein